MLNFIKNKSIGYYLACAAAVLSLVFIIVFYATIATSMPNSAAGKAPETIGIFMIGALVAQVAFLVLPEFGVIEVVALVLLGFSFYKELICCPQVLAAIVTGVAYEGGSVPAHLTYIILDVAVFVLIIVGGFLGYFKKEEDAKEGMTYKKEGKLNVPTVARTGGVAVALVAAVLVSSLAANAMEHSKRGIVDNVSSSNETPKVDPITDEMKANAEAFEYDFDPTSVHFTKEDLATGANGTFVFDSTISGLPTNGNRSGVNLVYRFEGSYAEGYQGDYSETYAFIYLWDDGLFGGKAKDTTFKGFWYNRKGEEQCLEMVSNVDRYESIIAESTSGFYERQAYLYLNMGWGQRSIICGGYMYYPEVALFIDAGTNGAALNYKVGDTYDRQSWVAKRVLKNLAYSSVFKQSEVRWSDPAGMAVNGKFAAAGDYEVKATWNGLEASINVHVDEAPAETPAE